MRSITVKGDAEEDKKVYLVIARRREQAVQRVGSVLELRGIDVDISEAQVVDNQGKIRNFTRHVNQYMSEPGGFVEDTAFVKETAFVDRTSTVEEGGMVEGNASVLHSRVYGSAIVEGNAILSRSEAFDSVRIGGNTMITDSTVSGNLSYYNAKISGKAINTMAY